MKSTAINKAQLKNGLTILYLHTKNDPIAACHLFLPGGASQEPAGKSGITALMWALFMKGTKKRTAKQLAEDVEAIGASIGAGTGHDFSEVSCHAVSDYFLESIDIMTEVLLEPAFLGQEVNKERNALIAAIRSKKENIFTVANEELHRQLYGIHAYARPTSGNERSVSSIAEKDLADWHRKIVAPNSAIFSVASNIPFKQLIPIIEARLGPKRWPRAKISLPKLSQPKKPAKAVDVQKRERFEQAYLMIGFPAVKVASPDYIGLKVLSSCLGGGMSARLFQVLREQQGLAYDVGAFFPSRKYGGAFVIYMGLQKEKLEQAKRSITEQIQLVRKGRVSQSELRQVKNYLKGTFLLDHQTNSQRAHYLGWWQAIGLRPEYDKEFIERIERVSAREVQRIANKYFSSGRILVEIVPSQQKEIRAA